MDSQEDESEPDAALVALRLEAQRQSDELSQPPQPALLPSELGFDDVGKLMVYPIPPEDIYAGWAENIDVLRALPILKNCSTSVLEAIMGEEVDWATFPRAGLAWTKLHRK